MLRRRIRPAKSTAANEKRSTNQATPGEVPERLIALKLRGPTLNIETLERTLRAAIDDKGGDLAAVAVDFSEVDRLVGPWTIHLAILIHLSKRIPVHVCGLHGQPLEAARLYRGSPELREMVAHRQTAGRPRAA